VSASLVAAITGLVGVIITAAVGYVVARRKASGTIDTTEAQTLWEQSNFLLERYKADLEMTRIEVVALKAEVVVLRALIRDLEGEALAVSRKLSDEAAVRLAVAAAEALAQPATGTPADIKARTEAVAVARTLAAKVKAEIDERAERNETNEKTETEEGD
jgi:hypothetical protein